MMDKGKGLWSMVEEAEGKKLADDEVRKVYSALGEIYSDVRKEMGRVVIGQNDVLEQILVSVCTQSHALLEGFPGLGKTLIVRTLSNIMDLSFKRIQCTPDIMPSDITGTYIIVEDEAGNKSFHFERGPVFSNVVLADEINRATPKAQSALLEAMQEKQVTVGNTTYKLDLPFFVLATQNPIEMEGTYPLPEAQLDRFLLKILVKYPEREAEGRIIDLYTSEETPTVRKVITKNQLLVIQDLTRKMPVSREIKEKVLDIVINTRPDKNEFAKKYLDYGASPRAAIGLVLAAKARALLSGRNYVNKDDIKAMAYPILRHRLILNFESERKGITEDEVIEEILHEVG
jgi:MoxR-like ATPase